jgi:hypothetical protein
MRMGRIWLLGLVCALTIAACDGTPSPPSSQSSSGSGQPSASSEPVPTSTCPPTARLGAPNEALPERQGAGDGATLWALFFPTEPVLTAGKEIKVAWRMTGSGGFAIRATGPDGRVAKPDWGPEPHGGSTWHRPGDEWGTGWTFPVAGCWTVSVKRTSGSGYLVLRVAQ